MRILIALTYYRPHVSGLTIYAERLARGLAGLGHDVTVLTSRFDDSLAPEETRDGVRVRRVPVVRKLGKGVVMPTFAAHAWAAVGEHDIVNVHMPQLEAAMLAEIGRARRRPVVLTYQCDLRLPGGGFNRIVERCLTPLNAHAARRCQAIVTTSADYAEHSDFLSSHLEKVRAIPPLVDPREVDGEQRRQLIERWHLDRGPLIGFAARFAAEKGVEILLNALPAVVEEIADVRVAFSGAYRDTIGEEPYWRSLQPAIEEMGERLIFLDLLADEAIPSFFSLCDVLTVTSLNSTEAYGLVQPEAMLAGTPVVATDLPGVREPVRQTGMGLVVPAGNSAALAAALIEVLKKRTHYVRPAAQIREHFDPQRSLRSYVDTFNELLT